MTWNDLELSENVKNNAPGKGWALIYTREEVIFESYDKLDAVQNKIGVKELLEVHLFDKNREYRCIATRSKRFKNGMVSNVIDFANVEDNSVYSETILLENGGRITVLNHVTYQDDSGIAVIDNYRLTMDGGNTHE